MTTVLLDTHDLGEAEMVLASSFSRLELRHAEGPTTARLIRYGADELFVDEAEYSFGTVFQMDPLDEIQLVRVRAGAYEEVLPGGGAHEYPVGRVVALGARHDLPVEGSTQPGRYQSLHVQRRLLSDVAAEALGFDEPVRLTQSAPSTAAANRQLVRMIDYVQQSLKSNPAAFHNPLLASSVRRHVAATLLTSVPNTSQFDPGIEERRDSAPALLRRAIDYIDDNAHRDISVADVAHSVYVTPRALQYMFRKHRECTPMDYLRRVRLHHAHLELLAADRAHTTIGQVAARWGFGHLGRFAVYYREHYGQSPHVTLRG